MELKLNISAKGIATTALQTNKVLAHDPIGKISFAGGGEEETYNWVTYVAKDRQENRCP